MMPFESIKMSADHDLCFQRVEIGAYEIARFRKTLEESGDLFRFSPIQS